MNRYAILVVGAGLVGCGNLTGDEGVPSPRLLYGRHLDVRLSDEARLEGELLAVDTDSLWMMSDGEPFGISLSEISRVRVQQHQANAGGVLAWAGVGALVTGAAMSAACASVAEECGGVFVGMAIPWALFGGLAAASVSGSRWREATACEADLSKFARYPQGWPDRRPDFVAPAGPPTQR
jgi:hypothetical protein